MREVKPLTRAHERGSFDCGDDALNHYLCHTARQHAEKGISRTFVLVDDAQSRKILGYATLSLCEVQAVALPQRFAKKYPAVIPGAKLARLAVDGRCQHQGIGTSLLIDMMQRTLTVAESVGIVALFVDAKHDNAVQYYKQFGFLAMADDQLHLFLPLETLRDALDTET
ncbi:MAG TPA: GNAT family N-acetyltransferase [Gammaproteobacteria bacterium]|nr:GNAT family N-acetyltransferase [Gammaproteobacteria bacterium]